jgi:hypothetical protein
MAIDVLATPAVGAILIAAWVLAGILAAWGYARRKPPEMGAGLVLLGILSVSTGLAWALGTWPSGSAGYTTTAGDLVFLGLLGFLGGIVATFGATIASWASRERRGGSS